MKLFCKAIIATLFAAATAKRLGETSFSRKLVENVPEAKSIPHKYHVIFDDSVSDVAAKVADINVSQLHFSDAECSLIDGSGAANATITRYYESVFKGMAVANMTNGLLQALERDPQVISIHQDVEARFLYRKQNVDPKVKFTTQNGAYVHLDRLDQKKLPLDGNYKYHYTGKGVTAYVIDTGILLTHGEFEGRASCGFDAVLGQESNIPCDEILTHGTAVASMVGGKTVGVAKQVDLVAIKVATRADALAVVPYENIIAGMDFIMKEKLKNPTKPMLVVMSLISPPTKPLDMSALRLIDAGIPLFLAAGNNFEDACGFSPQSMKSAITVGASYPDSDAMIEWSAHGPCVDIYAPGEAFVAWTGNTTHIRFDDGTSYSAPMVAGAAAMLLEKNPNMKPVEIATYLQKHALKNVLKGIPGNKNNFLLNVQSLL